MKLRSIFWLVFWLVLGTSVSAQPTVFFQPDDALISDDLCSSSLFCVEVHIDAVPDMAGYDIGIAFEPEYLNFLDAREGDIFALAGHPAVFFWSLRTGTTLDTVLVNAADLGGSVSGSGHLFSLCFVPPWNDGAVGSPLVLVKSQVRDSANADVPVVTSDGAISVYCPTATEVSRWGTIKSLWR